ncbi:MAG: response regulator, partial [Clostridiales bacterium]|nr:response regulator [Clostridiales bacterium]
LILMDMFMPVMNGIEAASEIAALGTNTPIVAMTANIMKSELETYKKHGMADCVGKPFTSQELWHCLLKYLRPVSVFDVDAAEHTHDDDLQKKLKLNFVRNNTGKHKEIAEAFYGDDRGLAHRLAHSLKTNAGLIGKSGLQNAAAQVEAMLKEGIIPAAPQMDALKDELDAVIEELKPLLDEHTEQTERGLLNKVQISALLAKLEPLLKSRNPECLALLDDIRSVPGAKSLAQQIERYDFKLAAQTLSELKKDWM